MDWWFWIQCVVCVQLCTLVMLCAWLGLRNCLALIRFAWRYKWYILLLPVTAGVVVFYSLIRFAWFRGLLRLTGKTMGVVWFYLKRSVCCSYFNENRYSEFVVQLSLPLETLSFLQPYINASVTQDTQALLTITVFFDGKRRRYVLEWHVVLSRQHRRRVRLLLPFTPTFEIDDTTTSVSDRFNRMLNGLLKHSTPELDAKLQKLQMHLFGQLEHRLDVDACSKLPKVLKRLIREYEHGIAVY